MAPPRARRHCPLAAAAAMLVPLALALCALAAVPPALSLPSDSQCSVTTAGDLSRHPVLLQRENLMPNDDGVYIYEIRPQPACWVQGVSVEVCDPAARLRALVDTYSWTLYARATGARPAVGPTARATVFCS